MASTVVVVRNAAAVTENIRRNIKKIVRCRFRSHRIVGVALRNIIIARLSHECITVNNSVIWCLSSGISRTAHSRSYRYNICELIVWIFVIFSSSFFFFFVVVVSRIFLKKTCASPKAAWPRRPCEITIAFCRACAWIYVLANSIADTNVIRNIIVLIIYIYIYYATKNYKQDSCFLWTSHEYNGTYRMSMTAWRRALNNLRKNP